MHPKFKLLVVALVAALVAALATGPVGAVAGRLITGQDIKDGSIKGVDIKDRTITKADLSGALRAELGLRAAPGAAGRDGRDGAAGARGEQGARGADGAAGAPGARGADGRAGADGAPGADGANGADGAPGADGQDGADGRDGRDGPRLSSGNWGVINRNTLGAATAFLRSGPAGRTGSVNLNVPSGADKATYGNEVDFAGDLVEDLTDVAFTGIYTTGENIAVGGAVPNMPSITFEIDPNLETSPSNYSSLVFVPGANTPANQWSGAVDATADDAGKWGLTGAAGAASGCPLSGGLCTWSQVQDALDDGGAAATIATVAVGKGRDYSWQGAIDGLTINGTTYDFEESGVYELSAGS